jgi:polar amino acid transport system permease protein
MTDPNFPVFVQRIGGLTLTLVVTAMSLFLGAPLGLVLAVTRGRPHGGIARLPLAEKMGWWVLQGPATVIVEVIRGIPVMILVLLTFYLPYRLFGLRVPAIMLAIVALSLYSGVYLSEIFRSGFRAVDERWIDAAHTLGLSKWQVLLRIKLPVTLRAMLPALLGLVITLFKDSSVLMVVGVPELTYSARQIQVAEPVSYALVLGLVLLIYWSLATTGSVLCNRLEKVCGRHLSE